MDFIGDLKTNGSLVLIITSLMAIFMSGIFFGVTYFMMDVTQEAFENSSCSIPNNVYVSNCQELWGLSVYPFLELKELLVWFSFFFIFALVFGLLVVGYQSGKSPVLMGVLIVFIIVITYLGIEISNVYRTMLDIQAFRDLMVPFTVYNRIMLNFPWFSFFVGLLSVMLSIVNYQKTSVNTISSREELNF